MRGIFQSCCWPPHLHHRVRCTTKKHEVVLSSCRLSVQNLQRLLWPSKFTYYLSHKWLQCVFLIIGLKKFGLLSCSIQWKAADSTHVTETGKHVLLMEPWQSSSTGITGIISMSHFEKYKLSPLYRAIILSSRKQEKNGYYLLRIPTGFTHTQAADRKSCTILSFY